MLFCAISDSISQASADLIEMPEDYQVDETIFEYDNSGGDNKDVLISIEMSSCNRYVVCLNLFFKVFEELRRFF